MELRQLRYFIAVADELHFSRAAQRLNIAQPALSQQIRQVERELDVELFTRTTRAVGLTDAGRVLADEGRAVLDRAELIGAAARTNGNHHTGSLRLGASSDALVTVLPLMLRAFRRRAPRVHIELCEAASGQQIEELRAGELDAGIMHAPLSADDMASQPLYEEQLAVAIPAEHPLARKRRISLEALAGEPFILFARRKAPALHNEFVEHCRRHGFTPRVEHEATGMRAALAMVGAGLGVSLLPGSVAACPGDGTAVVALTPPVPTTILLLIWRRGNSAPALTVLRETASEYAAGLS